ncbi:hypothetical protein [Sorangium sp. So ce1000]|uniref:hypothetical protein n=1 Tax=Sorangium sp. So ce1000 TaxID=3133325 RepID=UPI003F5FCD01
MKRSSQSAQRAAVMTELERVVTSPVFGGSARQIRLLRFLVSEALAGRGDELRAPLLATRIFDRPEGFDSTEDSIVRVEMSKLRRALGRYYAASPTAAVRIELPRGRYAPVFATGPAAPDPAQPTGSPRPPMESQPADGSGPLSPRSGYIPDSADGPVIAILPFTSIPAVSTSSNGVAPDSEPVPGSTGTRRCAVARGLTDRLGDLFVRAPRVRLLSRAATLDEAEARGARYVVEGSVRLVRSALRVTVKLHDTGRGIQVWGRTFDRFDVDDRLFAIEDEIAREIATLLVSLPLGAIHAIESEERSVHHPRSSYEVLLRFPRWLATFDRDLQAELADHCARFLARDPDDGVLLVYSSFFQVLSSWTAAGRDYDVRQAEDHARRAVALEPKLANAHQVLAFVLLDAGDGLGALAEAEIALRLGGPLMLTGFLLALAGDWERGTAILRKHQGWTKRYPGAIHHALALDACRRGDYAAALIEAESIAPLHLAWSALDRAVALARLGRFADARVAAGELAAVLPAVTRNPRAVVSRVTADKALVDDLVEALALAGLGCKEETAAEERGAARAGAARPRGDLHLP